MTLTIMKKRAYIRSWPIVIERILLIVGILFSSFYLAAKVHSFITYRAALHSFDNKSVSRTDQTEKSLATDLSFPAAGMEQFSLPPAGIKGRHNRIAQGVPLALLRIPRLKLEVPVLDGTDRLTLNSGVGRIEGTAFPGERGNIGIAGHRDSFFRALKDIGRGDTIELVTRQQVDSYVVDSIFITGPEDTSVLAQGSGPELTLVTCFPFRFIGPAPRRYVVRATLLVEGHAVN